MTPITHTDIEAFKDHLCDPVTLMALNDYHNALMKLARRTANQLEHESDMSRTLAHGVIMNGLARLAANMAAARGLSMERFSSYAGRIFDDEQKRELGNDGGS